VIFGTQAMADIVRRLKTMVDPANRFWFHPLAKLFG